MFKVECPGCKAPYQVDERRVPASGLKMRCPKCGTSFQVEAPDDGRRTGPTPVLGGPAPEPGPPPPAPARNPAARTIVGVAPSALGISPPPAPAKPPAPAGQPPAPARPAPPAPKGAPAAKPPVPSAVKPAARKDDPYGGSDLPAIGGAADPTDLPAPARAKPPLPAPAGTNQDLPAVPGRGSAAPISLAPDDVEVDADLPAIPQAPSLNLQLPSPLPATSPPTRQEEWDLPDLGGLGARAPSKASAPSSAGALELDLPDLSGVPAAATPGLPAALSAGLPSPAASLPSPTAGLPARGPVARSPTAGLPSPAATQPRAADDLPSLAAGLPMPAAGLPVPSAGLPLRAGELPLPLVGPSSSPPAQPSFSEIDLDMTATAPSVPPRSGGFGEIELPPAAASYRPAPAFDAGLEGDPFGDAPIPSQPPATAPVPLPSPAPSPPPSAESVVRSGGGSTSYGEVNLEGGASDVAVEAAARSGPPPGEDGIEFGAIPEEGPRAARVPDAARMPSHGAKRRQRWPLRTFAALLVVAVGGGSLSLVESVGPYGVYWIGDRLHAGEHERLLADSISRTQRALARDTWPEASRAFEELGAARGRAKRFRPFAAYVAFDGYLSELRFGSVPEIRARAKVLLDEVGPESPAYADLARAARLALDGELANAESAAARLVASRGRDVDAAVLAAEIALRSKRGSASVQAWQKVRALEPSARAAFGMARAKYAAGDAAGAEAEAKQALLRSPEHVGARILLARIASGKPGKEAETVRELDSLLKDPRAASPDEVAAAETLLGDVQLGRSHVSLAMAAYGRALKVRPGSAPALSGMGEALFQAGRYAEALPRFEGSVQAEPGSVAAEVGVAKSKLMLERIEDAARALAKLAAAEPKRPLVALWYGRALEAANDRDRASAIYHAAIDAGSKSPEIVDVYIALATLQNQRGQADEAQKTLATARDRLPDSALVYRALGELALAQARPSDAIRELEKALRIDPEDLAATFQLGVAQRRSQNFEAATQHFDKVAAVDHDYPGLALERGMIFEATGKGAEALKAYRDALAKAPKDPDLMLRVGCGGVAAGELEAAEDLLHKVLVQRPNSAEASHCLGRALLARNKLPDAQRLLDRAVDLDPTRAVFHLYSGWAANEGGNVAKADRELQAALALDNTLADAYWQRGVLRQRQGAVKDAVADLIQALKLNPARNDAHAALADAYYDLGREHDALAEWQKAVQAQPDNAAWRFRYGKLLVTNQMNDAGRVELERAVQWGEKSESPPRWLWEAHHFLARALGSRAEAAQHWEQFLRLGPRDSPYRKEAKQALERLGRPWSGN